MAYGSNIGSTLKDYDHVESPRVQTAPLSQEAIATFEGQSFEGGTIFTLAKNAVKYVSFEVPAVTDQFIGLQVRVFKSNLPDVELEILWNASISGGTPIPVFNNHPSLGVSSIVAFKEDPTVDETGSVLREEDFIQAGANANKSGGQIGDNKSIRIYRAGEDFVVKVTNRNNTDNKIKLAYAWLEPPTALLGE